MRQAAQRRPAAAGRIALRGVSKSYGAAPALSDVTLELAPGRIHALMGENGAGKSTLIRIMAGVARADAATLEKDGQALPLASAADAQAAGFRFIHQELNVVPQVSVAENVLLGRPVPRRFGIAVDWRALREEAGRALAALGADHIDPGVPAGSLQAGDQMLMRIAAALAGGEADLYVLDEPTAALSDAEAEKLFAVLGRLRAQGAAILYVSHRLGEVMRLSDDVTVLRNGRHVWTRPIEETSRDGIIRAMTGRPSGEAYPPRTAPIGEEVVAALRQVCTPRLSGITADLRAGEILGVAGLTEAGQRETLRLFLGMERIASGEASYGGCALPRSPAEAWARKVAYIPRERRAEALMRSMSVRANTVLPMHGASGPLADARAERSRTRDLAARTLLKSEGIEQPVGQLSGGNQQKVVLARALCAEPRLLLVEEPTRGVDIGARFEIHALMRDLAARGCAILMTSSDLPELLGLCDRVLVLQNGRQAHLLEAQGLGPAELLHHFYEEAPSEAQ